MALQEQVRHFLRALLRAKQKFRSIQFQVLTLSKCLLVLVQLACAISLIKLRQMHLQLSSLMKSMQWVVNAVQVWVVVTMNAINFVDGLDGLAGGIVAIAAMAFFLYAYLLSVEFGFQRATVATLLCALLAGMCFGFLPHNVFPARIFMGDTGSMLIGLLLGAAVITLTGRLDPSAVQGVTLLPTLVPLLLPLAVVAIPLIDVALAVGRRSLAGRSPFAPDKQHLHHRLLEMSHSQRRAVNLMYGWTALIAFTAVSMAFVSVAVTVSLFIMGVLGMVLLVRRPEPVSGPTVGSV